MSESFNYPRYGAPAAKLKLQRAEDVIEAFCDLYQHGVALFTRVPAAKDEAALNIRRAWLRASA